MDWLELGKRWGPWVLLSVFLVYFLTGNVSAQLTAINAGIIDLRAVMARHIADEDAHRAEERFFLKGTCLNTAKDDADRARCQP